MDTEKAGKAGQMGAWNEEVDSHSLSNLRPEELCAK